MIADGSPRPGIRREDVGPAAELLRTGDFGVRENRQTVVTELGPYEIAGGTRTGAGQST